MEGKDQSRVALEVGGVNQMKRKTGESERKRLAANGRCRPLDTHVGALVLRIQESTRPLVFPSVKTIERDIRIRPEHTRNAVGPSTLMLGNCRDSGT